MTTGELAGARFVLRRKSSCSSTPGVGIVPLVTLFNGSALVEIQLAAKGDWQQRYCSSIRAWDL